MKQSQVPATLVLLVTLGCAPSVENPRAVPWHADQTSFSGTIRGGGSSDTAHVAPPTGELETDRESILTAIERVRPGGTILFAPGTYMVGPIVHVAVPGITILGHSDGTTLRGCDPAVFEEMLVAVVECNGLDLAGGHQTVQGITFEYAWHALVLGGMECQIPGGCRPVGEPVDARVGGYLVEDNIFRNSSNGVRTLGQWTEPALIRDNDFTNTFHAVVVHGSTVHFVQNRVSAPEPERVPTARHTGGAIIVSATDLNGEFNLRCADNLIADNRVEGHPDAIILHVRKAGTSCRENTIRRNGLRVERIRVPAPWMGVTPSDTDSTVVGVPIALVASPHAYPDVAAPDTEGAFAAALTDNLVEENRISGAEGLGIEMYGASRNRIVANTITGVRRRRPFPGLTINSTDPIRSGWSEANGSGIWVSPLSNHNEIVGNRFEDIAGYPIVLEGDSNRVEAIEPTRTVRDLGEGNVVSPAAVRAAADAVEKAMRPRPEDEPPYHSRFVDAAGLRMHYLDFGGDGLPVVFMHSESWDAHTYKDFAPRFTDTNRVLAVTRPGYGESEPHPDGFSVETQARSLIDFLDALGIERAVFAGNSSPVAYLTYLAEHHPDRVAGVIYLAGLMPIWLDHLVESDPAGAGAMATRAMMSDSAERERSRILAAHRPEFLTVDGPTIHVPALAFAGRSGLIGYERFSWPLALTGSPLMSDFHAELPPSPISDYLRRLVDDPAFRDEAIAAVGDSAARAFLVRLVGDPDLQAEVWRYQQEAVRPALIAAQERFRRAFDRLRLLRLDVSTIYGYEYRDAPDLIAPHIGRFLDDLDARRD